MVSKDDLELQAASIESLNRQGITRTTYTSWLTDNKKYDKFTSAELMAVSRKAIENPNPKGIWSLAEKVDIEKGMVELTPLGKSFVKVCFNT